MSAADTPETNTETNAKNAKTETTGDPVVSSFPPAALLHRRPARARRQESLQGLPSWRRLRATRDFTRVERQGLRAQGRFVAVTVRPGPGRLGLVVSQKVDNKAHERNLIKRRLREIFRTHKSLWASRPRPGGGSGTIDVVVLARPEAKGVAFDVLRDDALRTLEQAVARLASPPPPRRR
jgi:ribonuclease P protein component